MSMGAPRTAIGIFLALVVVGSTVGGCSSYRGRQPLTEHTADAVRHRQSEVPRYHVIMRGDTLFSIAWRYGVDYRQLAALNGLYEPYKIYAGSRLLLRRGQRSETTGEGVVRRPRYHDRASHSVELNATGGDASWATGGRRADSGVDWHWPVRGQVRSSAPDSDKIGLEIRGQEGSIIRAAAPGEVVYSGDRLIGYGKLIIIRHNDAFLSAYGHNRRLLVSEGLKVAAGQQIAEMGSSGTDESKLYFEIRRHGKPVPPLDYLP